MLTLPRELISATFRVLRQCGQGRSECVVYWTGPAGSDRIDGYDHPSHRRAFGGYEVDDKWLTEFWLRLAKSKRSVFVQLHTHPGTAFHSSTDDAWPVVSQPGFVSIVIADFATGEASLDRAWVCRLRADGSWDHLSRAEEVLIIQ